MEGGTELRVPCLWLQGCHSPSTGNSTELHAQFHWGFFIWGDSFNHWPQDWTPPPAPPSPQRSGLVVPATSSHPAVAWRPRASPQNRTQTLVTQETPRTKTGPSQEVLLHTESLASALLCKRHTPQIHGGSLYATTSPHNGKTSRAQRLLSLPPSRVQAAECASLSNVSCPSQLCCLVSSFSLAMCPDFCQTTSTYRTRCSSDHFYSFLHPSPP